MMQRHFALALAMAIMLAAPRGAEAQQGRGGWQTMASGDEVLAVAADPFDPSVLWVGTEAGGLVRWDLRSLSFEQHVYPQQSGLDGNQVRDIALDAAGVPWLATDRGVTYAGSSWRTYREADGLPSDDITAVAIGADGTVWAGTRGDGMAELPPGAAVWQAHDLDGDANGPGVDSSADVAVGPDGRVWVAHGRASSGSQPALSVYDPGTGAWSHIEAGTPGDNDATAPPTDQIMALAFDAEGILWAGSWAHGVLAFDGMTWGQFEESAGVCDDKVWAIAASGGEVWVACGDDNAGYGVSRYDGAAWSTWTTADGLPTDLVTSIAVTEGVAYLGTNGPGDLGSGVVPVSTFVDAPLLTAPTTPYANDITAILFDDQGRAWVGTRGAGLMLRSGTSWQQFNRESTGGGLVGDLVTDLAWADGRLWIASARNTFQDGAWVDGGVSAYDPAGDSWFSLTTSNSGLPGNDVSSVAVDADGFVWLGVGIAQGEPGDEAGSLQAGLGVAEYDPSTDQFVAYYDYDGTSGTLTGNTVVDLATTDGAVWAASSYHFDADQRRRGGGVSRYADGAWSPWVAGDAGLVTFHGSGVASDPDPFITGDVRSVAVGAGGSIWAGTWDLESGSLSSIWPYVDAVVNRYDDGVWTADRFLGSGWVSAVVEDNSGLPWLGTTRGHDVREFDPAGGAVNDTAVGGARVRIGGQWLELTPATSGIASIAITALAVDPATGDVWVGTENEGLSVYYAGDIPPTPTPGGPTSTPRPAASPTTRAFATVAPSATPVQAAPTATSGGGAGPEPPVATATPKPPRDVPEPATALLMGAGLAGLAAWRRRRRGDGSGHVAGE